MPSDLYCGRSIEYELDRYALEAAAAPLDVRTVDLGSTLSAAQGLRGVSADVIARAEEALQSARGAHTRMCSAKDELRRLSAPVPLRVELVRLDNAIMEASAAGVPHADIEAARSRLEEAGRVQGQRTHRQQEATRFLEGMSRLDALDVDVDSLESRLGEGRSLGVSDHVLMAANAKLKDARSRQERRRKAEALLEALTEMPPLHVNLEELSTAIREAEGCGVGQGSIDVAKKKHEEATKLRDLRDKAEADLKKLRSSAVLEPLAVFEAVEKWQTSLLRHLGDADVAHVDKQSSDYVWATVQLKHAKAYLKEQAEVNQRKQKQAVRRKKEEKLMADMSSHESELTNVIDQKECLNVRIADVKEQLREAEAPFFLFRASGKIRKLKQQLAGDDAKSSLLDDKVKILERKIDALKERIRNERTLDDELHDDVKQWV
jgi:hypothetical protein